MVSLKTVRRIAEEHGMDLGWADHYCEPGYDCDKGVIFANWNDKTTYNSETRERTVVDDTPSRLVAIFEHMGYSIEWCDEWSTCDECGGAVRTSPDCHSWLPSYKIFNDCEILCKDCILEDIEGYAELLEDDPDNADMFDIDWMMHGYVRLGERYETGFHPWQNDDPRKVAALLRKLGASRFLFEITDTGQFDTSWRVWIHEDELELVEHRFAIDS
jgi:hypothetical protein